jgi:hydrogenase maturation protease
MKRITIGGIGNVLLGDDGVGPYVVSLLQETYSFPDHVEIIDFGTPSLDLLEHVADSQAVILLDAAENGEPPGTVTKYTKEDVLRSDSAPRLDPHSPAIGATLRAAELLGTPPESFLLLGITPEAVVAGSPLSASVADAAKRAVQCVIAELQRLGISVVSREVPLISLRTRLLMQPAAFAGSVD